MGSAKVVVEEFFFSFVQRDRKPLATEGASCPHPLYIAAENIQIEAFAVQQGPGKEIKI